MIEKCVSDFGRIDILVNNVGGELTRCGQGNGSTQTGAHHQHLLDLREDGRIAYRTLLCRQIRRYRMMQVMAKELARYGITANSVCPGYVWTPAWQELAREMGENFAVLAAKSTEEIFEARVRDKVPLGRAQTGEDIAAMVAFLASDRAKNITGQAINVDGGAVMH